MRGRTKARQCGGVGLNGGEQLQGFCEGQVSDEDVGRANDVYAINPPQSKEEMYYRRLFEENYDNMDKFVHVWEGGCRAGGAPWQNEAYTRAGLKSVGQLAKGLDGVKGAPTA